MEKIGCFEIEPLTSGRWKVKNIITTFEHVTYGTEEEVREQAQLQTEAWERKTGPKGKPQRGSAWRSTMGSEARARVAEKATAGTEPST
jgi:hypothetical protein